MLGYNIPMKRPEWHEYFMSLADLVKTRSNCLLKQVGVVLVKDKRFISTGYNGTPMGLPNCDEGGCERCRKKKEGLIKSGEDKGSCLCVHAEANAILQCAYHGMSTKDSVMYTTYSPCMLCAKEIINAGITEVYYREIHDGESASLELLSKYLHKVVKLP